jgi:hypothetical protein
MYQYQQSWGGPAGQSSLGEIVAYPLQDQGATITVCGYRAGREEQCYGPGGGYVFPTAAGMTQTVHSP